MEPLLAQMLNRITALQPCTKAQLMHFIGSIANLFVSGSLF